MKCWVGIDPGAKGAMAILYQDGRIEIFPYEKTVYLNIMASLPVGETFCVLEYVSAHPGQGVTSMFHFGETFGWLQGVLESFGIPYQTVTPQKWKRSFSVTSDKESSIQAALRLHPRIDLKRTPRSFKNDDNLAEAVLLSEYAKRLYKE